MTLQYPRETKTSIMVHFFGCENGDIESFTEKSLISNESENKSHIYSLLDHKSYLFNNQIVCYSHKPNIAVDMRVRRESDSAQQKTQA